MLEKVYEPQKYEAGIYKKWEESGAFRPSGKGDPFCIIMPPPNANGALHWGHAIGYTLTDVIARYARMQGKKTLWQPGTDHAGIETQFVYERDVLAPSGKSRLDFTPDQFYKDVMRFTLAQQDKILNQFKSMGFSADWSKLKFTLDPDIIKIVYETFERLYKDGYVYRGNRIVNWCPRCQAAFADIELEHQEREDAMYTLDYSSVQIATVRPETIFADVAVAVNPKDSRYKDLVGKEATVPLINKPIPVIADSYVDLQMGTGALKITPGHDPNDYEIGLRHNLAEISVIDSNGTMINVPKEFAGLPVEQARQKIIEALIDNQKLVKKEKLTHAVAIHDRCGSVIEPLVSEQWFLRVSELNKPVTKALQNEVINIFPKRFKKVALNWLEQEHDWCISRDSCWWGIRMPIFYKTSHDQNKDPYLIAGNEQAAIEYYGRGNYRAETATFDTWFSSGQWPYATLMTNGDFNEYYPTALMGTAREILHKWVTRMVMFGLYKTNDVPFKNVYLWGLVTDEHGKKMSKSKGNVIDPMVMSAKYGTDALRLAGAISNTPGTDSPMSESRVAGMRNFNNKLWNVARFVLDKIQNSKTTFDIRHSSLSLADEWMLERLNKGVAEITTKIDNYRINEASNAMYHLLWDDLADWYIESSKLAPNPGLLLYSLETILKLAHPFVPFVSEAIWASLPNRANLLIVNQWPKAGKSYTESEERFEQLKNIVTEIRNLRAELNLSDVSLYFHDSELLNENSKLVAKLSGIKDCSQVESGNGLPLSNTTIDCWLGVDHDTIRDYKKSLDDKYQQLNTYKQRLESQLANRAYLKSAPKEVVQRTRLQYEEAIKKLELLNIQIERLKSV
jgi:valyl-tRNA synthetase